MFDDDPFTISVQELLDYGAFKVVQDSSKFFFPSSRALPLVYFNEQEKVIMLNTGCINKLKLDGIEKMLESKGWSNVHLRGPLRRIKSASKYKGKDLTDFITALDIDFGSVDLSHYPLLPNVKTINFATHNMQENQKDFFKKFPALTELHLGVYSKNGNISSDLFTPLAHLKKLTVYHLLPTFPIDFWDHLPELTELTIHFKEGHPRLKELLERQNMPASLKKVACVIERSPEGVLEAALQGGVEYSRALWEGALKSLLPESVQLRLTLI